jgi:hypothetical protein
MSAPGVLRDQDDNFRELMRDRIVTVLDELSGDELLNVLVDLRRRYQPGQ